VTAPGTDEERLLRGRPGALLVSASVGWAGDALVPYRASDRFGYVWTTAWDSERDADEFGAAADDLAARFADRILLLDEGRTAAEGSVNEVIRSEVLERVYRWPVSVDRDPGLSVIVPTSAQFRDKSWGGRDVGARPDRGTPG
jgi:hypothetical protein